MNQIHNEIQKHKKQVKIKLRETVRAITTLYQKQLSKKNQQINTLTQSLRIKSQELDRSQQENASLKLQIQRLESMISTLQQGKISAEMSAQQQKEQFQFEYSEAMIKILRKEKEMQEIKEKFKEQLNQKNKQIMKLHNQAEGMSLDISTVSRNDGAYSFSEQISSVFRNSPHEMLKFLQSIPGDVVSDQKQVGNMTVMFVSRDGESLQKYLKVNRTFLKKKIKQHEKRFRFVLIYKPDKS